MFTKPLIFEEWEYVNVPILSHNLIRFTTKEQPQVLFNRPHIHMAVEFMHIRRGCMAMTVNNDTFTATAGMVVIANICEPHSAYIDASHGFVEFSYFLADLRRMMPSLQPNLIHAITEQEVRFRRFVYDEEIHALIDAMPELVKQQKCDGGAELSLVGSVYRTIGRLAEIGAIQSVDETDRRASRFVMKMTEFLDANHTGNITSEQICEYFHYNYSYFCRLFKENFGQAFHNYLEQYRINRAVELIQRGRIGANIGELAERVGIPDSSRFSHSFKKIVGMSPTEYIRTRGGREIAMNAAATDALAYRPRSIAATQQPRH